MKIFKILLSLLLVSGLFMSCENDNGPIDLFDKSPEERVNQTIADYKNILATPQYGWIGYYSSNNDMGGYLLLLDFDETTVRIKSEALDFINVPIKDEKITYKVGVKQYPELVFESYSIFQTWHDASLPGKGMLGGGEFQFLFDRISENEIVLKSKTDVKDVTYLTLRPARQIDWNLDGLPAMERKLFNVSPSKLIISQKLTGSNYSKFVELDIKNRMLYLEEEEGKVASMRFGVTRRGIVLLDTLAVNGENITEFLFSDSENTVVSDSPGKLKITNVQNEEVRYIKPMFAEELLPLAPKAFVSKTWVYTKSPQLKEVRRLAVTLKEYSSFYGIEFLPNLREFELRGSFAVDPKIDFSKNKELRSISLLLNLAMTEVVIENLPNLEVVVVTANTLVSNLDLTKSLPKLKEVHAHLNDRNNFSMNLKGLSTLEMIQARQNGWKSLDVTGCSSLKELCINSGNNVDNESDDDSTPTILDITGLSATAMPDLIKLWVPSTAKCGTNVWNFYKDAKAEGRAIHMMHGNSLITPEKDPQYIYNSNTCN